MGYCVCCVGSADGWARPMVVFGGCVGSADGWARPMAGLGRWWWFTEGESGGSDVGLDDGMLTVRIPLSLSL